MITSGPTRIIAAASAVLVLFLQDTFAETRIALVIGNGAYEEGPLDNPPRDAELMAETLRELDFAVTFEKDLDQRTMKKLIADFGDRLRETSDALAFFYYSGHGMQVKGRNYMIPVDARINDEPDVEIDGVSAWSVLTNMEYAQTTMNIVVLDACRNNPFEKGFKSPQEGIGLAPMDAPAGTLIAYATAPGEVADPGPKGGYSPFTATLANELRTSTAFLLDLFNSVSVKVYEESDRDQRPYLESSVVPQLAFRQPELTPQAPRRVQPAVGVYTETPPPGSTLRDCPECPEMVLVPAGEFTIGSPPRERGRDKDEGPQQRVRIAEPFWAGKYEVTFAEWDACVAAGGCSHKPDDAGWGREDRPVIRVSWNDAKEYVLWLSQTTGKTYRLLSEAEWEYAARARSQTAYWWGDDVGRNNANCHGCGSEWEGTRTAPVGSLGANDFGLYDTAGNISEWVEDCWHGGYHFSPTDGSAWLEDGPDWLGGDCSMRVLRGGSWNLPPRLVRSADRLRDDRGSRSADVGFRVARASD